MIEKILNEKTRVTLENGLDSSILQEDQQILAKVCKV